MRKLLVILIAFFLSVTCLAQNGIYIGYENGGLFGKYHYMNSKGFSLTQSSIGGVLGGYVGYKYNSYNLESGFMVIIQHNHLSIMITIQVFQVNLARWEAVPKPGSYQSV